MAYSSLITVLKVERAEWKRSLAEARREMQAFHREMQALGTIRIGATGPGAGAGGGSRLQTLGPGGTVRSAATGARRGGVSDEVRDQLADFAQIRRLQRDKLAQEEQIGRAQQQMLQRDAQARDRVRRQELSQIKQSMQERARLEDQLARQRGTQGRGDAAREERARRAARERELRSLRADMTARQRDQEALGAQNVRFFSLRSRSEERAAEARAIRDQEAARRRADVQRRFEQRDAIRFGRAASLTGVGGPGGRGPGGGGGRGRFSFDDFSERTSAGIEDVFKRATRAAEKLSLVTNVGIVGGLGAIIAEGFRVNSQFEKLNITMAATLGLTNDVVNAQGQLVEGPERTNFLLRGTAGFYDQIRDIAAKTIIEQQELVETVAENLSLAQQAGFKLNTLSKEETRPVIQTIANIGSLARAIGLPGGQRQLSQETRALFTGERAQGATIMRLLQFTPEEVKRLQQQKGSDGQSKFVEELGKRFKAVQPILDKFEKSAAGAFSAIVSQAREFLRLATESAFEKVTEALGGVRDFLTAERVASGAQRVGEALGSLVGTLIRIGQSPAIGMLMQFFGFLVNNAGTLIGLFTAIKGLQAVQGISKLFGGGLMGFLGGGGAGGIGGGVGRGGGFVSPARGMAIEMLSAAGTFGVKGALARQGAIARTVAGVPAAAAVGGLRGRLAAGMLGRTLGTVGGLGLGLGLTPAAIAGGTFLGGLGIGTALDRGVLDTGLLASPFVQGWERLVGQKTGGLEVTRGGPVGEKNTQSGREFARQISTVRDIQESARKRARALRADPITARQGGGGPDLPPLRDLNVLNNPLRAFTALSQLVGAVTSGARRAPDLTSRVTAEGLTARTVGRTGEINQMRAAGSDLSLAEKRKADEDRKKERLEALLSLAEVRRQREAAINIQAELDARAARKEIADQTALANKLKAIRMKRNQDIRELREDAAGAAREAMASALNDEEAMARLAMEREKREAKRRITDARILADTLAAIELSGQRKIIEGRLGNMGRKFQATARLAGARGQVFTGIVEEGKQELIEVARLRAQNLISDREFEQGRVAIIEGTQENLRRKRREFFNEGVSLTMRFTDLVRESTRLQEDYELNLLEMKERIRDREKALNQSRLAEVNALVNAQQELRQAQEALNDVNADQSLRSDAFSAFRMEQTGAGGFALAGIEERVSGAISRRGQASGEFSGLSREQREAAVKDQTRTFLSGLFETLSGSGGLAGARAELAGIGVGTTRAEDQALARIPGRAAGLRRAREERDLLQTRVDTEGRVADAAGGVADARDQRRETEIQDRRAQRGEARDARRLAEDFVTSQARLTQEFSLTQQAVNDFAREVRRAGFALSEGMTAVFQKALGVRVPSPDALAVRDATSAVAADQKRAAKGGGGRRVLDSHVGVATVIGASGTATAGGGAAASFQKSDAGGTTIINIPGMQLGPDTRALFEQLADKLRKEARVTG